MSAVSLAGSSAVAAALAGLQSSSAALQESAIRVAESTVSAVGLGAGGGGGSSSSDTVTVSDRARTLHSRGGLEQALVDTGSASLSYTASARVVSGGRQVEQALFSIVA